MSETVLLTRDKAAEALSMSLSHFQRYVQPHVRCVYIGKRRYFRPADLDAWVLENACVGGRGQ